MNASRALLLGVVEPPLSLASFRETERLVQNHTEGKAQSYFLEVLLPAAPAELKFQEPFGSLSWT